MHWGEALLGEAELGLRLCFFGAPAQLRRTTRRRSREMQVALKWGELIGAGTDKDPYGAHPKAYRK